MQHPQDSENIGVRNAIISEESTTVVSGSSSEEEEKEEEDNSVLHRVDEEEERSEEDTASSQSSNTSSTNEQETETSSAEAVSSGEDEVNTTQNESYETAIQDEEALAKRVDQAGIATSGDDDDIQSVDSDTAIDGRQTQREQETTDHSIIYGTYDESPVHTSSEIEEDDDDDLLNTSNNSSVHLPDYPTDEEENEIIFEEPSSPGGSVQSGLFGLSLWNIRAMSFDSHPPVTEPPPRPPSPEYQQDRGRFWLWRKRNKPKSKKQLQQQTPAMSIDPEPAQNLPSSNAVVSPTRTVATEGTASGVDTPMQRRRRRRRLFPRMAPGSSDDENDNFVELVSTDDEDIELGRRSHHSGSDHTDPKLFRPPGPPRSARHTTRVKSHHSRSKRPRPIHAVSNHNISDHDRSDDSGSAPSSADGSPRYSQRQQLHQQRQSDDATSGVQHTGNHSNKRFVHNRETVGDDDDSSLNRRRRRAQYQLFTFYRVLCLACIFVFLIIASSVATAFLGAMLALDNAGGDEDGASSSPTSGTTADGDEGNGDGVTNTTTTSPCSEASVWLQVSLKFDSRPAETSVVLQGTGIFGSPLWNFPESSFRSFTQFQRTNVFGICISRAATYELVIGDAAADGLVSTLGVSGFTTTIYGSWEITLDGVQRAVYHGNCAASSITGAGNATLDHCGPYCVCDFIISPNTDLIGGCSEDCSWKAKNEAR